MIAVEKREREAFIVLPAPPPRHTDEKLHSLNNKPKEGNIKKHAMASSTTFLVTSSLMLLIMAEIGEGGSLGVNFGRQASQKLLPSMVVDMCLANGISKMKTFSVNEGVLRAFSGTNIELIVAIPNIELNTIVNSKILTNNWMTKFIRRYRKEEKVDIRYICVGVEPFSKIERVGNDTSYTQQVVPLLKIMDEIVQEDKDLRGTVKLGVPVEANVLKHVSKPSQGDFRGEFKEEILDILKVLRRTDSPFMIDIYPYLSVTRNQQPLEFGLYDKQSNFKVMDGDLVYTNVFDFMYDTLVWALRKNGFGDMKIMVSQIGWPTDGGLGANVKNAKRFYDGLLKKVASNQGTPLLPGADLDVYLYVLSDENQRRIERGPFERHYGIYKADGKPKFNLDFTLQGRDIKPEPAMGVSYLPQRWCILNGKVDAKAENKLLEDNYKKACSVADCTALADWSSCSFLDEYWKVSYAFNSFFQMSNQEVLGDAACDFNGLGMVTDVKPTFAGCDFPVQILSTLFIRGMSTTEMIATLGVESEGGERMGLAYQLIFTVPFLWIVFLLKGR